MTLLSDMMYWKDFRILIGEVSVHEIWDRFGNFYYIWMPIKAFNVVRRHKVISNILLPPLCLLSNFSHSEVCISWSFTSKYLLFAFSHVFSKLFIFIVSDRPSFQIFNDAHLICTFSTLNSALIIVIIYRDFHTLISKTRRVNY